MAYISDDRDFSSLKFPDPIKECDYNSDISDQKSKKVKKINSLGINTCKLVTTCIVKHEHNIDDINSSSDEISIHENQSDKIEAITKENVPSQSQTDTKCPNLESVISLSSLNICNLTDSEKSSISSDFVFQPSIPIPKDKIVEDIPMEHLTIYVPSCEQLWSKMESLMKIWQEIAVTYQDIENVNAQTFKQLIIKHEWAINVNNLLEADNSDITIHDVHLFSDGSQYDTPEPSLSRLEINVNNIENSSDTKTTDDNIEPNKEKSSISNLDHSTDSNIGESSVSCSADIKSPVENGEEVRSGDQDITQTEVVEKITDKVHDSNPYVGEDDIAYEMVTQLNALGGKVIHSILINPATCPFPEIYRSKFRHLRALLLDNFPSIAQEIRSYQGAIMKTNLPTLGTWVADAECATCYCNFGMFQRSCCCSTVCESCLRNYFLIMIEQEGKLEISCPNCPSLFTREEVFCRISDKTRKKYDLFYLNHSNKKDEKACPRCCLFTKMTPEMRTAANSERKKAPRKRDGINIECSNCSLSWCFDCHVPNHRGLTCEEQRTGDKKLKSWAHELTEKGKKARRCPKCKTMTERNEGCPHMTCNQCDTTWCYNCGKKMRKFILLGDHDKKFSIFGCSRKLFPKCGVARWLVRGSILVGGIIFVPPLAVAAGGIAIALAPLGLIGLAIYFIYEAVRNH